MIMSAPSPSSRSSLSPEERRDAAAKFVAEIRGAREVCLVGAADLEFWRQHLAPLRLVPADIGGFAQILISAVQLKWLGLSFRELSVAVVLEASDGATPSVYLASAFNTSRMFAWCERNFFHTPYAYADVVVRTERPWSFELRSDRQVTLAASHEGQSSAVFVEEDWNGHIFLPVGTAVPRRQYFVARLSGLVEVAPYDPACDRFTWQTTPRQPIVQQLDESHYTPTQWRIRSNAMHARSKTFTA